MMRSVFIISPGVTVPVLSYAGADSRAGTAARPAWHRTFNENEKQPVPFRDDATYFASHCSPLDSRWIQFL
jgi:hypothetical protein